MSNFSPLPGPNAIETNIVVDCLFSCYKIMSHAARRGSCDYDLKARTETLNRAIQRFEYMREDVTFDVAIILWLTEEDHLVDSVCISLINRVSYPVVAEFLRLTAQWKGNPSIEAFHERLTRFVRPITAQKTSGVDHARTV